MTRFALSILGGILAAALLSFAAWAFVIKPHGHQITRAVQDVVMPKPIIVMAAGDANMGRLSGQKILAGDIDFPFAKLNGYLATADIAFVNLESQLADLGGMTDDPNSDYRFAGPPEGAQSVRNAGIDIVSVANNHMWDYGKDRLFETLDNLDLVGVKRVGANKEPGHRADPVILTVKNKKIAFFAMTTLLNGYERAGAGDYVSYNTRDEIIEGIKKIHDSVDWVFVSIHTGIEYQQKPTSEMVDLSHSLVDAGADAILGGHPHVNQPIEIYGDKPIFYSLGNFAFWQPFSFWTQHSFIAKLTLTESHKVEYDVIPVNAGWQPEIATDQSVIDQINSLLYQKTN